VTLNAYRRAGRTTGVAFPAGYGRCGARRTGR